MIRFERVGFSHARGRTILKDVFFGLDKGECVCLLGPNGTGKTTLLKCLLARLRPRQGRVTLNGRGRVAHLHLGAAPSREDRRLAGEIMERLGISEMAGKNFQTLSGGERQMVLFGRALAQQAEYLILDELTAALDFSNQVRVLGTVRRLTREGYGILMTTHFPDHAFLACSRAMLLRDGHVLEDGPPEKAVTNESLTKLYHVPVCVPLLNDEGEAT